MEAVTPGRTPSEEHVCVDCPQPCPECDYCAVEQGRVSSWWRWLRIQYRCSPLTAYGRRLRRRAREPFDPADYIEVERP